MTAATCCHNLLPRCMLRAKGKLKISSADDTMDDGAISDDDIIGAPRDFWRSTVRRQHKQDTRWVKWVSAPKSVLFSIIWIVAAQPVMHLHFFLFRDAKTAYQPSEHFTEEGQQKTGPIFELPVHEQSRIWRAIAELASLLYSSHPGHNGQWGNLHWK